MIKSLKNALKGKRRVAIIVFGLSIAWFCLLVGFLQIDHMFWTLITYEDASNRLWVPELGLSYKDCFELFGTMIIASLPIALLTWYFARKDRKSYFRK